MCRSAEGVGELLERGLVREQAGGTGVFRHALAREALYADIPWVRRRSLHRTIAEALEAAGAPSREIATHWLGAGDSGRARVALLQAAAECEAVHAFRDAAELGRKALEVWPEADDDDRRAEALERYAHCAELAGELAEAARAWRALAEVERDSLGPMPSAGSPACSSCAASASRRSPRGASQRRRSRPTAIRAAPPWSSS